MIADFVKSEKTALEGLAKTLRGLCLDTVLRSQSGHIGLPLGAAEIATLLYFGVMDHDPSDPNWFDRDRFVLSAGHGSALLYGVLHLAGYGISLEDLKAFRRLGSITPGHPEYGLTPGVECTTGPLGQGVAMAAGMALGEAHLAARFNGEGASPVDHKTFVLAGDGCLMEGVAAEAVSLAGHLRLNRLITFYDDNRITIDGTTEISFSEDVRNRFKACGWSVFEADGHDFQSLAEALDAALECAHAPRGSVGPSLIVCRTHAGRSLSRWEDKPKVHGNPHSADDVREAKASLGLPPDDFHVAASIRAEAARLIETRRSRHATWKRDAQALQTRLPADKLLDWNRRQSEGDTFELSEALIGNLDLRSSLATRQASGMALADAFRRSPELIGGSADLAVSNNTTLPESPFISAGHYAGSNIHFGVREHAMGAMANGLALHGGLRPFVATFAVFSDYMRPAIRLAALMKLPVTFIFTHDSYAVGEDGPTHQPIEHAASLRVIPGLQVLRPADTLETFAAWEVTLNQKASPTALLLTRQALPNLDGILEDLGLGRRAFADVVRGAREGAMVLKEHQVERGASSATSLRKVTLLASGSEVQAALKAAQVLERGDARYHDLSGNKHQISVRVISVMDSTKLARNTVLLDRLAPKNESLVGIEAGSPDSFAGLVGRDGFVLGLDRFGESAPAKDLEAHFGFSPEAIADRVLVALALRR